MKKAFLILMAVADLMFTASAQTGTNTFTLNGKLTGQNEGLIYLYYTGSSNKRIADSCEIKNGYFSFKGNIDEPVQAFLTLKEQVRGEQNSTTIYLEPAVMNAQLKFNDFRKLHVTGSKTQDLYTQLERSKEPIELKYKLQLDSLRTEKDHEKNAEIRERLAPYFKAMDQADYTFFKAHPSTRITAYMLRFHVSDLSPDELQHYYDGLGPQLQQTADGKDLAEEIRKIRMGSPGSAANNFTTSDLDGKPLSLSDYKGKYVILDFWASWCVPCRKGNPHLKELYSKYKDRGMEIIGVSDDDRNHDAWKKAVEKDGLPWKHVLRGLKYTNGQLDRSNSISDNFGIHTLPTKILIDPNGVIIGRYGEEEQGLDKKLAEVFKS